MPSAVRVVTRVQDQDDFGGALTDGQFLKWDSGTSRFLLAAAAPAIGTAIGSATVGSVLFVGAGSVLGQDNANLFWDDTNNRLGIGTASPGAHLQITSLAAGTIGQITKGAPSQTANLHEYQNSSGTVLANITASGQIISGTSALDGDGFVWRGDQLSGKYALTTYANACRIWNHIWFGGQGPFLDVDGYSGTLTLDGGDSSSLFLLNWRTQISGFSASVVGLVVQGAPSQSANLQDWRNSSGTVLTSIGSAGYVGLATGSVSLASLYWGTDTTRGFAQQRVDTIDYIGGDAAYMRFQSASLGLSGSTGINWLATGGGFTSSAATFSLGLAQIGGAGTGILEVNAGILGTPNGALRFGQPATGTIAGIVKGIASRTAPLLQLQTSAGVSLGNVGGTIFNSFTDTSTTNVDGTEDDLYSYTLVADTLAINGDSVHQREHVQFVSSATATRRLKKYFGGTLIFDSGALTLTLGGDFFLETMVIRESSTVVRVSVNVVTTSASSVPYATYTRITGLTLTNTQILKTTGIAAGAGAASGDIVNKLSNTAASPAA